MDLELEGAEARRVTVLLVSLPVQTDIGVHMHRQSSFYDHVSCNLEETLVCFVANVFGRHTHARPDLRTSS